MLGRARTPYYRFSYKGIGRYFSLVEHRISQTERTYETRCPDFCLESRMEYPLCLPVRNLRTSSPRNRCLKCNIACSNTTYGWIESIQTPQTSRTTGLRKNHVLMGDEATRLACLFRNRDLSEWLRPRALVPAQATLIKSCSQLSQQQGWVQDASNNC